MSAPFPWPRAIKVGLLVALFWWRGCSLAYHAGWRDGFDACAEVHRR